MNDDQIRGTFMGYHLVLGALVETHPDLSAFKAVLGRNMTMMQRNAEGKPDDMLHPAEHMAQMFDDLAERLLAERG